MLRRLRRKVTSGAAAPVGPPLVVWDFDWSLINANSDTAIIPVLDPSGDTRERMEAQYEADELDWTELIDWVLGVLHAEHGCTPAKLDAALASLPMLDGALQAVAAARAAGAEQRILSDANDVFIGAVLRARGLAEAFGAVETNRAAHDADGRLRLRPHQTGRPHRCKLCPPNLCKGAVLDRWLAEPGAAAARCVYVGDGSGDYCAATRLRPGDVLLARRAPHDGLLRRVREQPRKVAARVVEWGGEADASGAELAAGLAAALGGG